MELEAGLWVAAATLAAASTGGAASALNILYAVPIALAWTSGRPRLTAEAAGFSVLGYALASLANASGPWLSPLDSQALSAAYGTCALIMVSGLALFAVAKTPARDTGAGLAPVVAKVDPEVALKVKQAETRARQAEEKLSAAQAEAESAKAMLEARTRFFAQTSHELRTPLNAISGFAEMMKNNVFGPLPDRYQEYAELIHEGGQGLGIVVDGVLDLARIEAIGADIRPDLNSLTDIAAAAVHFMGDMARRKSITLEIDRRNDVEAFVDDKAVKQIALNLISNALKFTPEGGTVSVETFEATGGAWLAVSDTGAGMTPEELLRLSYAFQQGAEGRKHKGTGLGLSIVRALAEAHGGRLEIESRHKGGSTIAVFFPAEPEKKA